MTTIANTHDAPVAKQVPPAGLEGEGVKEEGAEGESLMKAVPQVVEAIGQISNYFGTSAEQGCASGQLYENVVTCERSGQSVSRWPDDSSTAASDNTDANGQSQSAPEQGSTAIGQLSHDAIGRLAGEIAEHLRGNSEKPCKEGSAAAEVPSYAPEKCLTGGGAYGKVEPGKGSLDVDAAEPVLEVGGGGGVSKLEGMLVSEEEIFGGPLPEKGELRGEGGRGGTGEGQRVLRDGQEEEAAVCRDKDKGTVVPSTVVPKDWKQDTHKDEVRKDKGIGVHKVRGAETHKDDVHKDEGAEVHKNKGGVVHKVRGAETHEDEKIHRDEGAVVCKDVGAVVKDEEAVVCKDKGAGVGGAGVHKDEATGGCKDEKMVDDMGMKREADEDSDTGQDVWGELWDQRGDFMEEGEGEGVSKAAVGEEGGSGNQGDGDPVLSSSQAEMFEEFKKLTSAIEDQSTSSKTSTSRLHGIIRCVCLLATSKKRERQVRDRMVVLAYQTHLLRVGVLDHSRKSLHVACHHDS